jgi:uncharacterized protein YjeT (DUF2065 family)
LSLRDLVVAIGLVLAVEGMLYAVAPGGMKRLVALVLERPEASIRWTGLITAIAGVAIVWFARGL